MKLNSWPYLSANEPILNCQLWKVIVFCSLFVCYLIVEQLYQQWKFCQNQSLPSIGCLLVPWPCVLVILLSPSCRICYTCDSLLVTIPVLIDWFSIAIFQESSFFCMLDTSWAALSVMSMSSEPVFPSVCCILVSRSPCVLVILYSSFPYNLFILVRVVGRFCHPEVGCAWLFCMLPKVSPSHVSKLSSILLLCNDLLAPAPDWELPHHQATIK